MFIKHLSISHKLYINYICIYVYIYIDIIVLVNRLCFLVMCNRISLFALLHLRLCFAFHINNFPSLLSNFPDCVIDDIVNVFLAKTHEIPAAAAAAACLLFICLIKSKHIIYLFICASSAFAFWPRS